MNEPARDGVYFATFLAVRDYTTGEVITVSATAAAGIPTPSSTSVTKQLFEGGDSIEEPVQVDTDGFPGTLTYTIPADAPYRLAWTVDVGGAQWQASCEPAATTPSTEDTNGTTPSTEDTTGTTTQPPPTDGNDTTSTTVTAGADTATTAAAAGAGANATAPAATAAATATPRFTG